MIGLRATRNADSECGQCGQVNADVERSHHANAKRNAAANAGVPTFDNAGQSTPLFAAVAPNVRHICTAEAKIYGHSSTMSQGGK